MGVQVLSQLAIRREGEIAFAAIMRRGLRGRLHIVVAGNVLRQRLLGGKGNIALEALEIRIALNFEIIQPHLFVIHERIFIFDLIDQFFFGFQRVIRHPSNLVCFKEVDVQVVLVDEPQLAGHLHGALQQVLLLDVDFKNLEDKAPLTDLQQ